MKVYLYGFLLLLLFSNATAQRTILHCGHVVDIKGNKISSDVSIVITENKITEIQQGYTTPDANDRVVDLRKGYVMPGLIDMHVHLEGEVKKGDFIERFTFNEADVAYRSVLYAKRTLLAGFTTVRDLGGSGVNISLRNAINNGVIPGPRVLTAGKSIATTGGHADPTNGYRRNLAGDPGPLEGVINGVDEARQAVRYRYKQGSDLIKITATGGVLSIAKDGAGPQFTDEELRAIVSTAKDYGMHTAAHAHGPEGMRRAVLAGITTIEHGTEMTEEIMDLMKEKGTYYVPTISAGRYVADKANEEGYFHTLVVPKAKAIGPQIQKTFGLAYKRGVKIAFGTDSGVSPHGENAKEFVFMVEAGMPANEALASATTTNASILGMSDQNRLFGAGNVCRYHRRSG
jgi:imidazolonepropionase-like amidohydrolase